MPKIYPRCKGVSIAQSEGVSPKECNWFSYVRIMRLNSKQVVLRREVLYFWIFACPVVLVTLNVIGLFEK